MDDPKTLAARYQPKEAKALKADRQLAIVRFSPCGRILAGGCFDGTVRRWDLSAEEMPELAPIKGLGGWVQALAFHSDGKRLFAADSWGKLCAFPYADAEPQPLWSVAEAHNGWIRMLAVSPDGSRLATCGIDQKIRLWSAEDGKLQTELTGHSEDVFAVAFHPDGKSLVSGDHKGVVKKWDLADGSVTREFDAKVLFSVSRLQDVGGVRAVAFDREGKTLACAGTTPKNGGNVQGTPTTLLFDWETGKLQHTLKVGNDGDAYVCELCFHPGGFVMGVTSGNPGVGKLFFHRPGDEQPFFIQTKMPNCHSLAVHPNGIRLAVSATNGGSNGNGRRIGKDGEYPGNYSPLHILDLPQAAG
jgi:WD40 repeat protein